MISNIIIHYCIAVTMHDVAHQLRAVDIGGGSMTLSSDSHDYEHYPHDEIATATYDYVRLVALNQLEIATTRDK